MKKSERLPLAPRLLMTLLLPLFGVAASAVADAAGDQPGKTTQTQQGAQGRAGPMVTAQDMRASELIGMRVTNAQGEDLGEINDLIVDVNNKRVHYAVLAFGGTLGLGEKLFAYPVKAFSPGIAADRLVLNVDKERLQRAPGFERNNWPDWRRDDYRTQVDRHFGPTVSLKQMPNQQLVRATEVLGKNVDDSAGRNAGEIEDLVVNLGNGVVHYAVLDVDRSVGDDGVLMPVALDKFNFQKDIAAKPVLNMPRDRLDISRGFRQDAWPDFSDPNYRRDMERRLGGGAG